MGKDMFDVTLSVKRGIHMKGNSSITYQRAYWLFLVGSLLGLVLEGFWCMIKQGHWEMHVNFIWEPLCGIYGVGLMGCELGGSEICEEISL